MTSVNVTTTQNTVTVTEGDTSVVTVTLADTGYAFPGGASRSIQARLQDYVSVKDFGAVGDGVTDDTAAIQAAINAGSGQFPYTVVIPNGNYRTTATIQLTDGCRLLGVSRGSVRFLNQFSTGTFALANNVRLENILIEGTDLETDIAIVGDNTSRVNIRGVDILGGSFDNHRNKALKITGNSWMTLLVYECVWDIGNQVGWAVQLEGNATTPQNIDTHFRDVFLDTFHANVTGGSGGFYLKDVSAPRLSDCLIRTSAVGVNVWINRTTTTDTSPCDVLLENCTCEFGSPSLKTTLGTSMLKKGATSADIIDNNGSVIDFTHEETRTLPSSNRFSWINQGSATINQNKFAEHVLFKPGTGVGTDFALRKYPVSGDFILSVGLNGGEIAKPFHRFGIGVRESATGKFTFFGLLNNATGAPKIGVSNYSSPTAFVSDTQLLDTYLSNDIFLRIQLNSGNLTYLLSTDGVNYFQICQTASNSFITGTIDNLFYGISSENGATPNIGNQMTIRSWNVS